MALSARRTVAGARPGQDSRMTTPLQRGPSRVTDWSCVLEPPLPPAPKEKRRGPVGGEGQKTTEASALAQGGRSRFRSRQCKMGRSGAAAKCASGRRDKREDRRMTSDSNTTERCRGGKCEPKAQLDLSVGFTERGDVQQAQDDAGRGEDLRVSDLHGGFES